jgi:hypothetical protein
MARREKSRPKLKISGSDEFNGQMGDEEDTMPQWISGGKGRAVRDEVNAPFKAPRCTAQ